jgi:hypothetical protein
MSKATQPTADDCRADRGVVIAATGMAGTTVAIATGAGTVTGRAINGSA